MAGCRRLLPQVVFARLALSSSSDYFAPLPLLIIPASFCLPPSLPSSFSPPSIRGPADDVLHGLSRLAPPLLPSLPFYVLCSYSRTPVLFFCRRGSLFVPTKPLFALPSPPTWHLPFVRPSSSPSLRASSPSSLSFSTASLATPLFRHLHSSFFASPTPLLSIPLPHPVGLCRRDVALYLPPLVSPFLLISPSAPSILLSSLSSSLTLLLGSRKLFQVILSPSLIPSLLFSSFFLFYLLLLSPTFHLHVSYYLFLLSAQQPRMATITSHVTPLI